MFDLPRLSFILLRVLVKTSSSSSSLSTTLDVLLLPFWRPFGIDWTWMGIFLLKREGRSSSSLSSSSSLPFLELFESGLSRPFFSSSSSSSEIGILLMECVHLNTFRPEELRQKVYWVNTIDIFLLVTIVFECFECLGDLWSKYIYKFSPSSSSSSLSYPPLSSSSFFS